MRPASTSGKPATLRTASGEADFWAVRRLLQNNWGKLPPFYNWEIRRWDGAYFHNEQPGFKRDAAGELPVGLWETAPGEAVAAMFAEGGGDAWFAVDPDYRELEPEMLDWAEANLARPGKDGRRRLAVFCWDSDVPRQDLLASRGFARTTHGEVIREKSYGEALPPLPQLPAGYRLYTLRPGNHEDCQRYAELLNAAFRRTFHLAAEVSTFTTMSPSFRPELELIAQAPDGSFAALAGMIYDEVNRFGLFEPVCATPKPRPLGLTGLLMAEGHRRVRLLGAKHCYVGTGVGMAANRFYEACGFRTFNTGWMWEKVVDR